MATVRHSITLGNTLTPMSMQLVQEVDGAYEPVNLTGKTVKFMMVTSAGVSVVAETTTGVTVTSLLGGTVQYDFLPGDVDTAGVYYAWFIVYAGTEFDTFPADGRTFEVVIYTAG